MYFGVSHACGALGGQKGKSDLLELELQFLDTKWVVGIEPRSPGREVTALNC